MMKKQCRLSATPLVLAAAALILTPGAAAISAELDDFAVFGTHSVDLGYRSVIDAGDVGSNQRVHLGPRASVAGGISADRVRARAWTSVEGDIHTNQLDSARLVRVGGEVNSPLALPIVEMLPPVEHCAPGADPVHVGTRESRVLPPGAYAWVWVAGGAELVFEGGDYRLERIVTAPGATIRFAAPATLCVHRSVRLGRHSQLDVADGVAPGDVRIGLRRGVFFAGRGSEVAAEVLAPHGGIWLGSGSRAHGVFLAKRIRVGAGAQVTGATASAPSVVVPELLGLGAAEARATLEIEGLSVGVLGERPSAMIPAGDVVAQSPPAGSDSPAGSAVDLVLSAAADPTALSLPVAWAGVWNFEIAQTRAGFETPHAIDAVPGVVVCPGDPVGVEAVAAATAGLIDCTGDVDGATVSAACSGGFDDGTCAVAGSLSLDLIQSGDAIDGTGTFTFDSSAGCPDPTAVFEDEIRVTATRASSDPGPCQAPASSLGQKLFEHPEWLLLEGGL